MVQYKSTMRFVNLSYRSSSFEMSSQFKIEAIWLNVFPQHCFILPTTSKTKKTRWLTQNFKLQASNLKLQTLSLAHEGERCTH